MPKQQSKAFTLVELLVVIAIVGVLISLLLPAVQAAREAARRAQCTNNLRQIGVALHSYHTTCKSFPPGAYYYGFASEKQRGSILVHLLPYIEQNDIYDMFDFSWQTDNQATGPEGGCEAGGSCNSSQRKLIGSYVIPVYICPSDSGELCVGDRAKHNYVASGGPNRLGFSHNCSCTHGWDQFSMSPFSDQHDFAGPFTRYPVQTKISDCSDGLASTIYFGETRPECSEHVRRGWVATNNGNGLVSTVVPINFDSCRADASAPGCERPCNMSTELGFKSCHNGGVNFLFGDSSVHFLAEEITHDVYQCLGAKADGRVVKIP